MYVVILAKPMPQSPRYGMVVAAKKSENIDLLFLLLLSTTTACGVARTVGQSNQECKETLESNVRVM